MSSPLVGCAIATAIGAALDVVAALGLSSFWQTMLAGSPRYSWMVGLVMQACIFPVLMLLDALESGSAWLDVPIPEASVWRYLWYYAICGYWAKDFVQMKISWLVAAHHALCLGVVVPTLLGLIGGSAHWCLGSTLLELGSLANNIMTQLPGVPAVGEAGNVGMCLSNVASALVLLNWVYVGGRDTVYGRLAIACTGVILMGIRQSETNTVLRAARLRWLKESRMPDAAVSGYQNGSRAERT